MKKRTERIKGGEKFSKKLMQKGDAYVKHEIQTFYFPNI